MTAPRLTVPPTDRQRAERRGLCWWVLAAILVVGVALRAVLMPRLGHVADTYAFFQWSEVLARRSVAAVYLDPEHAEGVNVNYPPVYLYVLSVLPRLHDACVAGLLWSDPRVLHGMRQEALRLFYLNFAERVRKAGTAGRTIGAKAYEDTVADMAWAGLDEEFRAARVKTYADLVAFFQRYLLSGSHLVADHRSVLAFLKLPATVADLALAGLLLVAGWRWVGRWPAVLAGACAFLNPVVAYESAYWGQVDSIPTVLVVACLLALTGRTWWLVFPLLAIALLVKLQAVIVVPVVAAVVLVALLQREDGALQGVRREAVRIAAGLAIAGVTVALILFPVARGGALRALLEVYTGLGSQYPYLSVRAFNLWWLFTNGDPIVNFETSPRDDVPIVLGLTPKAIGFMLLLAAVGFVVAAIVRRRGERAVVMVGALVVAMSFFSLQTEIHERYGFPIVPLAILAALAAGRRYWWVAGVASLTHFGNLFFSGLAERPGGPPIGSLAVSLATPGLTTLIAVVNLALLAFAARDLYQLAFVTPVARGRTAGRAQRGGRPDPRQRH
jgi:hypothetical protein